ncbi:predicted protein [Chaetomium globosum CBS 148.51]|uniref:Nephrocystin 3-like N-terminal domain-containing protein n=1 Tax=Chaetomium globosum (strain ATCC 6205 / CBS 148.51 / DSM 1962 / NBRC 6347 / NRRL 1970) TaxID=306901 RepID=Q2GU11_CHAGB|nr:uncharacterized protein CHGG_08543 [Chaetomium globosum CBS 148.51]EAQ84529.1 predicted protein [Chaetomium globosum CBS 148.51]
MVDQGSFIPAFSRPVTVAYIDHHLQQQHPMFANPPVQYNPLSGQYTPNKNALAPCADDDHLPSRPDLGDVKAMRFWNGIFPDAMAEFKTTKEPHGRASTDYSIRSQDSWDEIYRRLEAAQAKYQQVGGPVGWLRKVRRKMADNIAPVAGAVGIAGTVGHGEPIVTPVLGAVEMVLDALEAFNGLVPIFSDVELFLGTFPGDPRIRSASVDLTVTILDSIERAIGFFISNEFLRAGKALLTRGDYEKSMVDSLTMIKTRSSSLMEEAAKSHIHEFHMYSQETRKFQRQLLQGVQNVGDGLNSMNRLFAEYALRKERELEATRQENLRLHIINERLRATTPTPQVQTVTRGPHISQGGLRRMLDTPDLDLTDLAFVNDKKGQLPERERTQAEQIINTHLFQNWAITTRSSKLLVHWDFNTPQTIADVSPLSVVCATMTQALRAKEHFVSAVWFCGQHTDPAEAGAHIGGRAMLHSLIDQLLRQHAFDVRPLCSFIDPAALQAGRLDTLIQLLEWLVRQLPETTTFFCIIDGVCLFERDEFQREAVPVLLSLIRLAGDTAVSTTVKVLLTSTPGTDIVRGAFEEEDLILNVDGLPQLGWAPNDERMIRELDREMDEAAWSRPQTLRPQGPTAVERAAGTVMRWTGGIVDTNRVVEEAWKARWLKERDGRAITRPADDFDHQQETLFRNETLRRHDGLSKAKSSLLIQIRTGAIGLRDFLFTRGVPEVLTPACECGEGRETAEHLVVWCLAPPLTRRWERTGIRTRRDFYSVLHGINPTTARLARRVLDWLMDSGKLPMYNLARRLELEAAA